MTKAEITEEYQKLLEKYDELKMTAQMVGDPKSVTLLERTRDYTVDQLTKSLAEMKTAFGASLDQFAGRLTAEAQKLGEMQQAVELSRKNLELHYHIQVAAETLQQLVAEHETKQRELAKAADLERQTLADEQEKARRDWTREQEEHDYRLKVQRQRAEEQYAEAQAKREKEFRDRVEQLRQQEVDVQNLRKQVEAMPTQLERSLTQREQEVTRRLRAQADAELAAAKKEWAAAKNVLDLKISTQLEQLKQQGQEIAMLRQEAERANRKAQELAVKVIESGRGITAKPEEKPIPSSPSAPMT